MRTEDFKRGVVFTLLVLCLVFSMISVTPLASSGDWVNRPEPGGTTIEVVQGENILIRHVLEWNESGYDGAYTVTIGWVNYENKPEENFTFLMAEAYFISGAYTGEHTQADVTLTQQPSGENTKWALSVGRPADNRDSRDGQFNVDIWLKASGVGGVLHAPTDNHPLLETLGGVIIFEKYMQFWNRGPITIRVGGRGIRVSISPSENSGLPAQTLSYTVTVKNIGDLDDTYDLTVSDNAGWGPTLSQNSFEVPAGENRQTTLSVKVPANAPACTKDKITVTATSQGDPGVSDNAICIAHAAGVDVMISPSYQSGLPGEILEYTVTVKNFGVAADNYTLENKDNAGWSLSLDNASLKVPAGENRKTTLRVTIPNNSIGCTSDNITVIATLTENVKIRDNGSCIAHVAIVRRVKVSIDPPYQENENEGTLTYTVTVANTGNVPDTYTLEKADTRGWPLSLEDISLEVPKNENRTTTLTVTIPVDAIGCTEDTVTVTATSTENTAVSDSDNCIAHVTVLEGVNVNISPSYRSGVPGAPLTYTITVKNIGVKKDNYVLTVSDNESWNPKMSGDLSDNKLEDVQPGENRILTLSVTIPEDALPCTEDNLTVTATSQTNTAVSDNASCIAHSVFLELTFYPIDDAEVIENKPDNNYGTNDFMYIGYEKGAKRVFLKFKLENIPAGATIERAELSLRVAKVIGGGEKVRCYRVDNDDWGEHTITWNDQPSIGEFLDNRDCSGGYQRYYWDVKSFVESQWKNKNDRSASFCMLGAGENNPPTHYAELYSKEKAENDRWPFLKVFYRTSANSFSVSISPTYQSALRGRTLNYTVMLKNVGWENGSYRLENLDDAGWSMTLDKVQFENVPPGESRTATLAVTIPDNAPPYTHDNVTVIATLIENEDIRGDASCVAHSTVPSIEVSITPKNQSGVPGQMLTYKVMVKNVGLENDSYSLEVTDNEDWNPTLDNNLLENVPPGENKTTTLRVTIHEDAVLCTEDNITIIATSLVDNTVKKSASCIAHSGFAAVGVSITPENQSGLPGATLAYTVTIKNTGNVEDTYDLSVSDNAGWGPTLSENLLMVPIGESRQTTLNVMVPANAPICTRDNITITTTSRADTTVDNSASCIAHSGLVDFEVLIKPDNQSGEADYNILIANIISAFDLEYTVTVVNKGTITDNYILTVSDNAGWGLLLSDNTLKIPGGENKKTTLYVEIPSEGVPLSSSNITVTATSQTNNTVRDASCVARVAIVDFEITLSPSYQRGLPGEDLFYVLTVTNTGTGAKPKIHVWSLSDTENWITPENASIPVLAGESANAYLTIRVLDNAAHCTKDNLIAKVMVYSHHTYTLITKETSAIAHATTLKQEVIILAMPPKRKEGKPGDDVSFRVVVRNLGLENDTYDLTVVDDALPSWNWRFDDNLLENVQAENSRETKLWVTIPDDAPPGMEDNLMVIATSRKDPTISASDNCIVLVENFRAVEVSISPENKIGDPGETLTYEVNVKNKGSFSDNYALTATDSAGWGPTLSKDLLELAPQDSDTVTLTVTIPSGTSWGAQDTITITAKSTQDPTVSDKASCIASVVGVGVEVYISPARDTAEPGKTLTFTVTVRNTGSFPDNYVLTVSDNAGWGATLADDRLTVPADANRTTTVSVEVPSDAVENESTEITVVATSQAAPTVSDSASCIATAKSPVTKGIPLLPLAISVFLIGAAIIVPTYLLRVRPKRAARPWLPRDWGRPGAAIPGMGRKKAARRSVLRDASYSS